MKIEEIKIDHLTPYKINAKKHPVEQIEGIAESIKRFGFTQPIVIDSKNVIIIGHGRHEAAKKVGLKTVPCVKIEGLSDKEIRALRLIDNRIAETEWDQELLKLEFEDLDFDFSDFNINFDSDIEIEPIEGLTDPDEVPETPEQPKTKLGDIYILGDHRLMCGDSANIAHVEKLMGGGMADMVFTDPPYGLGASKSFNNDHPDYKDDETFDLKLLQLWDCEYVIWGANYYEWLPAPRTKIGWIVWDKRPTRDHWDAETRAAADRRFGQHFEMAVTNISEVRGKMLRKSWGGFYGTAGDPTNAIVHKTQKPIELAEICFQKRHKIVLDYFGGSGSTLIACEKTNRKCFMMELDPKYCDVIIKRWEDFTGKKAELMG